MKKSSFCIFIVWLFSFTIYGQNKITISEILGKQIPLGGNENPYKLRTEVYKAFIAMKKAAMKEGIEIKIVSGYRSLNRQRFIWDKKFKKYTAQGFSRVKSTEKIIEYSTYPGTSRHHWGTDIDIVQKVDFMPKQLLNARNFDTEGAFCVLHDWMQKYAADYGFYLAYTNDINRKGFSYEPWHYSYKPTATLFLNTALKQKVYNNLLKKSNTSLNESYISTHILGVNLILIP